MDFQGLLFLYTKLLNKNRKRFYFEARVSINIMLELCIVLLILVKSFNSESHLRDFCMVIIEKQHKT